MRQAVSAQTAKIGQIVSQKSATRYGMDKQRKRRTNSFAVELLKRLLKE